MEPDDLEALRDTLRLLRGISEDRVVAAMERGLAQSPAHQPFPMPSEAHPALAGGAEFVRHLGEDGRQHIALPLMRKAAWAEPSEFPTAALSTDRIVLDRRRCVAPAPYVGPPAVYVWDAWMDPYGRSITTGARRILV
jgi:hypothetical protein